MLKQINIDVWGHLQMLAEFGPHKIIHTITLCACKLLHRYWPTITTVVLEQYAGSVSSWTFLRSCQIMWTMVITTVQHSAFPSTIAFSPYVVVTKCKLNASTSADNWYQNTPQFPNSSISSDFSSVCPLNYLFIPAWNINILSCRYFMCTGILLLPHTERSITQGFEFL